MSVPTVEQRLGGAIGDLFLVNARLGYEVEITRRQVQEANERANDLSVQLQDARARLEAETARADAAEARLRELQQRRRDDFLAAAATE